MPTFVLGYASALCYCALTVQVSWIQDNPLQRSQVIVFPGLQKQQLAAMGSPCRALCSFAHSFCHSCIPLFALRYTPRTVLYLQDYCSACRPGVLCSGRLIAAVVRYATRGDLLRKPIYNKLRQACTVSDSMFLSGRAAEGSQGLLLLQAEVYENPGLRYAFCKTRERRSGFSSHQNDSLDRCCLRLHWHGSVMVLASETEASVTRNKPLLHLK